MPRRHVPRWCETGRRPLDENCFAETASGSPPCSNQDRTMPSLHYSLPFAGLVLLVLFLAWHYRHLYVDRLPLALSSRIRHYTPLRTFEDAAEQGALSTSRPAGWAKKESCRLILSRLSSGFSTSTFDLSNNLSGDQRAGLDDRTLTAIRRIMERENVPFDEARLLHLNSVFRKNGASSRSSMCFTWCQS